MFKVRVHDNFHYMDDDEAYTSPLEFATVDEAIAHAQSIVRKSCAHEGYDLDAYKSFGDDPSVIGPQGSNVEFSAWNYAEEVCAEHNPPKAN